MSGERKPVLVSIPLTTEEVQLVNRYRSLHPQDSMKVSKNQNGELLYVTIERHETLRIEYNMPPQYGTMNE